MLEMIPALKPGYKLESISDEEELAHVLVPRNSLIEKISIRYLKQPAYIRVRLDRLGSFVLSQCDGTHPVEEIGQRVSEKFGEEAEPLFPRLLKFFEIIEANGWITWK